MKNLQDAHGNRNARDNPPSEPFTNAYAGATRQAAEQSLKSLDASVNWALTLTLGILAFVIHAVVIKGNVGVEERGFLLAILGIGSSMLVHFAIRSAKNYLNIVRFAKLEREALKYNLKLPGGSAACLTSAIDTYHVSWRSPLAHSSIVKKVLFEFGFLYLFTLVAFMYWYIARGLPAGKDWIWVLVLIGSEISVVIELLIFHQSPYMQDPAPDLDVQGKA